MPIPLTADCLSEIPGIRHGFFTREGGVSSGIYKSLNCGLGSNDSRDAVMENRARVARHLGAPRSEVVTVHQTHSATAIVIDAPLARDNLPKADAIVTRTPGLVIGALAADCTPVLFADPEARVVGAAHAGWRGATGGVLEATIAAMVSAGAVQARIRAAVGPCINQSAYEVGPEFEAAVLALDAANARFFGRATASSRPHFDLPAYVAARLGRAGIGAIERRTPCTDRNESEFFSYRRSQRLGDPDYGRQISAIVVA
ncbi:MAG: peptidoglycan editing factor PgeF [Hyphomicrobium sp.]